MEDCSRKGYRLYNVLFPVYMLFLLFPPVWAIVLPFNFAFDSLVLVLAVRHYRYGGAKEIWKRSILRVWGFGFLADIAGAAFVTLLVFAMEAWADVNVFFNSGTELVMVLPGVALAGWLIYLLDRKWAFGKMMLDAGQRHKLALTLAIFTAPYTMLIPTRLLYMGKW